MTFDLICTSLTVICTRQPSLGSALLCCTVLLQMDRDIKDGLKEKVDKPEKCRNLSGEDKNKLTYCVTDVPPWYLCIFLSIQVCAMRSLVILLVVANVSVKILSFTIDQQKQNCKNKAAIYL